jgi:hypothetical protein
VVVFLLLQRKAVGLLGLSEPRGKRRGFFQALLQLSRQLHVGDLDVGDFHSKGAHFRLEGAQHFTREVTAQIVHLSGGNRLGVIFVKKKKLPKIYIGNVVMKRRFYFIWGGGA